MSMRYPGKLVTRKYFLWEKFSYYEAETFDEGEWETEVKSIKSTDGKFLTSSGKSKLSGKSLSTENSLSAVILK